MVIFLGLLPGIALLTPYPLHDHSFSASSLASVQAVGVAGRESRGRDADLVETLEVVLAALEVLAVPALRAGGVYAAVIVALHRASFRVRLHHRL